MKVSVLTTGVWEPLDLDVIKHHLRIEEGETAEDVRLMALREAARTLVEARTGRALTRRTEKYYLNSWPACGCIDLPNAPLASIPSTGVVYKNSAGTSITLSSTAWESDTASVPGRLCLGYGEQWPSVTLWNVNPISVEYVTGYSTRTAVPNALKQAMLILISDMYENRESVVVGQSVQELPPVVDNLASPFKTFFVV